MKTFLACAVLLGIIAFCFQVDAQDYNRRDPNAMMQQMRSNMMTSADRIKLDGIQIGATKNQTDSYLLNRANHTGTQTAANGTVVKMMVACD